MHRLTIVLMIAALSASPAAAQITLGFGTGGDAGNSTATVTTEQATPSFDGAFTNATVLSGVNIRSAPSSHGSDIIGTLHEGDTIAVRCKFGWCELANGGGYTAEKFLSLDGQSFDLVQPPEEGAVSTGDAPAVTAAITAPGAIPPVAANFDGLWTAVSPTGGAGMPLILKQDGNTVTGTLQTTDRLAKLSGDVEGRKLNFTYDMLNKAGKTIASGNGFLALGKDSASLSGVLMLNGLVVSNINASH